MLIVSSASPPLIPRKLRSSAALAKDIIGLVAAAYGMQPSDLRARTRMMHIVVPRHVAMYLLREVAEWSYPRIGRQLGYDHSSILHGCRNVMKRIADDPEAAAQIEQLMAQAAEFKNAEA